ncbi:MULTISPECIES: glycosyltransferase family A protein [unclassified Devosia]|uniref:glycosyltransferase family 2 protein n=1 Tax=unclassified Devosia TaxID=196773 RepID=UPI000FDC642D|nr:MULTISPECIES: glycosyltransferase family A protein [unclassified Devosia]
MDDLSPSRPDPLVSVVVPAFNAAEYIERTLHSAAQQTYKHLEIIVVNDGSTDDTLSIAEKFTRRDDRLRIITISNGGVARARNLGVAAARGAFVAFLDADDLWHPAKLVEQVRAMTDGNGRIYAASYVLHRRIDWDDRVVGSSHPDVCSGSILARHLVGKFVGNGSSLMARRSVVLSVGGFDPSYADAGIGGCEDLDIELKLAERFRIVGVPSYLVGYRSYPGNMSSDSTRMARSIVATVERRLAANPDLPRVVRNSSRFSTHMVAANILFNKGQALEAAQAALQVFRYSPVEGSILFAHLAKRYLHVLLDSRAGSDMPAVSSAEALKPRFFELDPSERIDEVAVRNRTGLRLAALALIDKGRKKRLAALDRIDNARISKLS